MVKPLLAVTIFPLALNINFSQRRNRSYGATMHCACWIDSPEFHFPLFVCIAFSVGSPSLRIRFLLSMCRAEFLNISILCARFPCVPIIIRFHSAITYTSRSTEFHNSFLFWLIDCTRQMQSSIEFRHEPKIILCSNIGLHFVAMCDKQWQQCFSYAEIDTDWSHTPHSTRYCRTAAVDNRTLVSVAEMLCRCDGCTIVLSTEL